MPTTVKIQPLAAGAYENTISEQYPDTLYQNPNPLQIIQAVSARKYSFIQFWLDQIPAGSIVTQAKFGFRCVSRAGNSLLRIYQVVDAWYNDEVTWNNRPINGTPPYEIDVDPATNYEVDITAMVQYWMNNPEWNLGLCLVGNLCETSVISITGSSSNDPDTAPYLEVTYTPGPSEWPPFPTEESYDPIIDTAEYPGIQNVRVYIFHTLPTKYPFYCITGIGWKNGNSATGNIMCGVDLINADPPTIAHTPLLAMGRLVAQSPANDWQVNTAIASKPIPGGSIIGVWISGDNGSSIIRYGTYGIQNMYKILTHSVTPPNADNTAWNVVQTRYRLKVLYKGII